MRYLLLLMITFALCGDYVYDSDNDAITKTVVVPAIAETAEVVTYTQNELIDQSLAITKLKHAEQAIINEAQAKVDDYNSQLEALQALLTTFDTLKAKAPKVEAEVIEEF